MPRDYLKIKDYDGDVVTFDCKFEPRFYVECNDPERADSTCSSLDRPAARAIIAVLTNWLGEDEAHGIKPCEITWG